MHLFPYPLLAVLLPLFLTLIRAETFQWKYAFQYINFGTSAPPPYVLYNPTALLHHAELLVSPKSDLGVYADHVWSYSSIVYTLDLTHSNLHSVDIKLGFAEVYPQNCRPGARVMSLTVANTTISPVDIFSLVGCKTPHDVVFKSIKTTKKVIITISATIENPMLSNIVIRSTPSSPNFEPTVLRKVSKPFWVSENALLINVGRDDIDEHIPTTSIFEDASIKVDGTVRAQDYHSYREGIQFTYHFKGDGAYSIQLGFAEINPMYCNAEQQRIFSVFLNEQPISELTNLNVFQKQGCHRAYIWNIPTHTITTDLFISFRAVVGKAMVSHIVVRKIQTKCIPESSFSDSTSDHLAHSVPGHYPPITLATSPRTYVDSDKNGHETVFINGDGSHTHFFDVLNNINGRVTRYEWSSPDTGEFLSDKISFKFMFVLGTTRMTLAVVDNICSTDIAETSVTVTGSILRGSYCHFYTGRTSIPDQTVDTLQYKPDYAYSFPGTSWNFESLPISADSFAARCMFFLEIDGDVQNVSSIIDTEESGIASLFRGSDAIARDVEKASFVIPIVANLSLFELTYVRSSTEVTPTVKLYFNNDGLNPKFSHDQSTTIPVIANLTPQNSSIEGTASASVKVIGRLPKVQFLSIGDRIISVAKVDKVKKRIYFDIPKREEAGIVPVTITWKDGLVSNSLKFSYLTGPGKDRVAFSEHVMKDASTGESAKNGFATTIRIGSDGDLYLGTVGATVIKLSYDMDSLTITKRCGSAPLTDERFLKDGMRSRRDILGMVLDPRDAIPRPYVSSQTLFRFQKGLIDEDNVAAWRNGAIDRLKPGVDPLNEYICLVFDKRIVSNLPVSNHDHGVNGLEFTQDGDLLISIGGFTNAGLPGKGLGQGWEVPLSGSIVLARITSQKNFDGTMTYSNDTHPHRGIVTGGGLAFVATGIRNAFFLSLHSSGRLYTVDNGPNVGFGNVVANCEEADLNIEYPTTKVSDWPGTVELGPPGNKYSIGRPDKLLHIRMEDGQKARFYGHANLNRKECSWIDPLSGRDGLDRPAPDSYQGPLDLLTSSVNAVVEYHVGNVFDGEMRGKLILSTFQNRKTYMMGAVNMVSDGGREIISKQGGLCAVVNGRGDIIIGRFTQNDILVLRPKVGRLEQREEMSISGVTPFRHGLGGGTMASISGYNFGVESVLVEIGGRRCRMKSQKDNLIQCEVPDGNFSGMAADVRITKSNGETAELKKAVWYMRV